MKFLNVMGSIYSLPDWGVLSVYAKGDQNYRFTKNLSWFSIFLEICCEKFQGYKIFWLGTFLDMVYRMMASYWYAKKINIMQVLYFFFKNLKKAYFSISSKKKFFIFHEKFQDGNMFVVLKNVLYDS